MKFSETASKQLQNSQLFWPKTYNLYHKNMLRNSYYFRVQFTSDAWGNSKKFIFCVIEITTDLYKKGSWIVTSYHLTLWEPAYDVFVPRFRPKTSSCQLPYQCHSSSADCARELFKGSNGSASLVDCTQKNFLVGGCGFFMSDIISSFQVILAHVAWPRAQPLGQSISLKFSLETRLESESFEPLIDFLAFLVQKLSS